MKYIQKYILSVYLIMFLNAQPVGWEDAAFRDRGDGGGSILFFILGIVLFIWFVFFSDSE